MIDWTIYRDGSALLTRADTIHDALRATVNAETLPLVRARASTERTLVGAMRVDSRYADDRRVDLVYKLDATVFEVERVEEVDLFRAVLAWVGARREQRSAARAWVPASFGAVQRAQRERIEGASDMIASAREVLDVADPAWTKLDPSDASELRELLGEKGGQPRNAWGASHCAGLERALSCVRSVEVAGMGVGTPVAVLRSGFDDDPYAGPGVVIDVHPSERGRFDEYHSREVRLDSGAELSTSTRRLELR